MITQDELYDELSKLFGDMSDVNGDLGYFSAARIAVRIVWPHIEHRVVHARVVTDAKAAYDLEHHLEKGYVYLRRTAWDSEGRQWFEIIGCESRVRDVLTDIVGLDESAVEQVVS